MDNKILNIRFKNFLTELRDMTIFDERGHPKKWSDSVYIAITFEILVQNQ